MKSCFKKTCGDAMKAGGRDSLNACLKVCAGKQLVDEVDLDDIEEDEEDITQDETIDVE